jgi:hypothetical protein
MRSKEALCPQCGKELLKVPAFLAEKASKYCWKINPVGDYACVNCLGAGGRTKYYWADEINGKVE